MTELGVSRVGLKVGGQLHWCWRQRHFLSSFDLWYLCGFSRKSTDTTYEAHCHLVHACVRVG